jgi:hypothetical protein
MLEKMARLVWPLSGWRTGRGLQLAREIITALDLPVCGNKAGSAPDDVDVCCFRILERPVAAVPAAAKLKRVWS